MNKFVGLSYGAFPKKLSDTSKLDINTSTDIFNNYHNNLYVDINKMRNEVLQLAKQNKYIHLGLGCIIKSNNPDRDIRTLFNACSQFWSILTLITIHELHKRIGIRDIRVIATIYDSIYLVVKENPLLLKWLNDNIVQLMTTNFLIEQIVPNEATGSIGYNWYDLVDISNFCSLQEINQAIEKAKELISTSQS